MSYNKDRHIVSRETEKKAINSAYRRESYRRRGE